MVLQLSLLAEVVSIFNPRVTGVKQFLTLRSRYGELRLSN